MAESGSVKPETVVDVLMKLLGEGNVKVEGTRLTVIAGDNPRVYLLTMQMTRKTIHHIARHSGVQVHYFYNPEMIHGPAGKTQ